MARAIFLTLLSIPLFVLAARGAPPEPAGRLLFDFEAPADLKAWSNLELPDAKDKEPAVKMEIVADHATSGKHSLKLTFAGGRWPTITTTQVPDDWLAF